MSRPGVRVLLVVVLAVLAVLPGRGAAAATTQAQSAQQAQVVVVGAAGLRWDHVPRMPALAALAEQGARGSLSVKAAGRAVTCPDDGWLTLGAGNRAQAPDAGPPCAAAVRTRPDQLPELRRHHEGLREGTQVGALGDALRAGGACASAEGPGARLAAADRRGTVADGPCPVHLVDAGAVLDLDAVDAAVAAAVAARSPGSTLLVVGVAAAHDDDRPALHVALAVGPDFPAAGLVSASTRRAPYVQLLDVAPTVLDLLALDRGGAMVGQPWRADGDRPSVEALVDLDRQAAAVRDVQVPFYAVLVAAWLLGAGIAVARRSPHALEAVSLVATAALGASYLANLVPWWRVEPALAVLVAVVALLAGAAALAARRVPGLLGPAGALCAGTAVVLLVDLVSGGRLQMSSVAGYSPLVAGRFAGLGNVAFGVLLAAVLLGTAWLSRRRALPVVLVAGGLAVAVVGAPPWGSDVGGVLALVPAVAVLAMLRTGTRVSWLRLAGAGVAGGLVVAAFAALDLSRPADRRTHLGRFAQDVLDGSAGAVLVRKAQAIGDLLLANAGTALLPVVFAAAAWLLLRPPPALRAILERVPAWHHGLLAVGAGSLVGLVANDSGPAIPAFALLVAVPATAAVAARAALRPAERAPL